MIDFAGAILIGRIASVPPTRWNRDSGGRWEDPSGPIAGRGGPVEKLMFAGEHQAKYTLTDDEQVLNSLVPGRDTTLQALLDEISAHRKE